MVPQRLPGVLGAETASLLQQRHHPVDELVESVRSPVSGEDEAVARIALHVQVDLISYLSGGADELWRSVTAMTSSRMLRCSASCALTPRGGEAFGSPCALGPGDRGIVGRVDVGSGPSGS